MIDLAIDSRIEAGNGVVTVGGDVDLFTAPQLRQCISDLLNEGVRCVIIDLTRVGFLDSTGLGVLVGSLKRVREASGDLVLVGPQRPVRRVLSVTGLDKIFTIHENLGQVLDDGDGVDGVGLVGDAAAPGRS